MNREGMQIPAQHPASTVGLAGQMLALEEIQHLSPLILGQAPASTPVSYTHLVSETFS